MAPPAVVWVPSIAPASSSSNGLATAALVVGICATLGAVTLIMSFFALPAAIVALVLGIVAFRRSTRDPRRNGRGHAIAGIVLGAAGSAISVVGILVAVAWYDDIGDELRDSARESDWRITVEAVSEHATVPSGPNLRDAHFVAVEVTATNRGFDDLTVAPDTFHLEDANGTIYRHCVCRAAPGRLHTPSQGVPPGEAITGIVWFVVDDGSEPVVLVWYHGTFFPTRTEIELPR
jgi:hypothetical protein